MARKFFAETDWQDVQVGDVLIIGCVMQLLMGNFQRSMERIRSVCHIEVTFSCTTHRAPHREPHKGII